METGAWIFLFVVVLVAFGIGDVVAKRVVPIVEGEPWIQGGKRNVVRHLIGWGTLLGAALLVIAIP